MKPSIRIDAGRVGYETGYAAGVESMESERQKWTVTGQYLGHLSGVADERERVCKLIDGLLRVDLQTMNVVDDAPENVLLFELLSLVRNPVV